MFLRYLMVFYSTKNWLITTADVWCTIWITLPIVTIFLTQYMSMHVPNIHCSSQPSLEMLMKIETWYLRGSELPRPDWRERISSTFEGCRHQSEWLTDWTGRIVDRFVRKRPSRQCRPRTRICFPENLKLHLEYFSWERNDTNHHLKLHITKKYSE